MRLNLHHSYSALPSKFYAPVSPTPGSLVPILESVDHALKDTGLQPGQLPPDDFTRAVAVATVSALRHQQVQARRVRNAQLGGDEEDPAGHGGHDAPSWSRAVSASVLLACTALYAVIAGGCMPHTIMVLAHRRATELLVDVVDVVLNGSGIDEKFLGITLFALVPNTTEFMNAMSFAMNGNIALGYVCVGFFSVEIFGDLSDAQYGNRFCVCPSSVPFTDPRDGGLFGVVRPQSDG